MSRSHVPALILAAACWGLGAVVSKHAVTFIPPFVLLVIQLAASLLLMSALAMRQWRNRPERRVVLLGLLNPGLAYLLNLAGLTAITAGLSVTLWALEPVLIAFLAWWLLRQRLSVRATALSVCAVLGAVIAGAGQFSGGAGWGVGATVGAVGCCAVYAVAAAAWAGEAPSVTVVASQQAAAFAFALVVLGVARLIGVDLSLGAAPSSAWVGAVFSGFLYYGLAYWAFVAGLRRTTAAIAGQFINLVPVVGIGAGWLLLGERFQPIQVAGGVVVVVAVAGLIASTSGVVSEG